MGGERFVLIAAVSVLLLLTKVALAVLSLSAVTVKSSRIEWAQEGISELSAQRSARFRIAWVVNSGNLAVTGDTGGVPKELIGIRWVELLKEKGDHVDRGGMTAGISRMFGDLDGGAKSLSPGIAQQ